MELVQNKKKKTVNHSRSTATCSTASNAIKLRGLIWDSNNYSCAYDALLTILFSIWMDDPLKWNKRFKLINNLLSNLAFGFSDVNNEMRSFENVRDTIRHIIHNQDPNMFPFGTRGIDICDLAEKLMKTLYPLTVSYLQCEDCGNRVYLNTNRSSFVMNCSGTFTGDVSTCFQSIIYSSRRQPCVHCNGQVNEIMVFHESPSFLIFTINNNKTIINKKLKWKNQNNSVTYRLRGLVYYGDFHFTCRIITQDSRIWFHDGIETRETCQYEGNLDEFHTSDLLTCGGRKSRLAVYVFD